MAEHFVVVKSGADRGQAMWAHEVPTGTANWATTGDDRWYLYPKDAKSWYTLDDSNVERRVPLHVSNADPTPGHVTYITTGGYLKGIGTFTFNDATAALTIDGNYIWKSGTGFTGTLDHANTGNRTYTFPDADGTVPLGTGTANQVAYWSAPSALTSDANLTYDGALLTALQQLRIGSTTTTTDQGDVAFGVTGSFQFVFDRSAGLTSGTDSTGAVNWQLSGVAGQSSIINSRDLDCDTIIRGDTDTVLTVWDASTDRVGIGLALPLAKWHVLATTEQLRLAYNATNYASLTVASNGLLSIGQNGTTHWSLNPSVAGQSVFTMGVAGITNAVLNTADSFYINIDSNNNSSDRFEIATARTGISGGTTLLTVLDTGATTIAQWLNVGLVTTAVDQGDFAAGDTTNYVWHDRSASQWLQTASNAGATEHEIRNTGVGGVNFELNRTAGTVSDWYMYLPTGSTNLRFFSTNDKIIFALAGGANVFNEQGEDIDTRFEGDNKVSNFLLDASDDEVAIDGRFSLVALTPAQITADQNDYNPESTATNRSSFWRLSSDAARNITGIANGLDGRVLKLVNVGSFNIVIQNQNALSAAGNRVITGTGADITLAADDTMDLIYDNTTARWRVFA